jgi:glutamate/tyrosine decarboxylase-like PLP-dependent enzyme
VSSAGGRYFGFVIGGSLPATVAASWLASTWDQNAARVVMSAIAAKLEEVAMHWMLDLLGLPSDGGAGFVTCATQANFSALAAARHVLLARRGWNVETQGLFGAPPIQVVVGDEVHASILKALTMLGMGRERVVRVPVDDQGRMRADALPPLDDNTILCLQAGNVNTGAFDPADEIIPRARAAGAWIHIDGAFGLWAAAAPARAHLMNGFKQADSWATDAHKWLNVPYDSGLVFVRRPQDLHEAMAVNAPYLATGDMREPERFTPDFSRRARGIEVWAALRSLGRAGLADLIERNCRQATRFAEGLRSAGYTILNEVALNQVLVEFGDAETTRRTIAAIQAEGTCWAGATIWQGHTAMRISVSSWATTDEDVERSLEAMIRVASEIRQGVR